MGPLLIKVEVKVNLSEILRGLKKGTRLGIEERKLFLEHHQKSYVTVCL